MKELPKITHTIAALKTNPRMRINMYKPMSKDCSPAPKMMAQYLVPSVVIEEAMVETEKSLKAKKKRIDFLLLWMSKRKIYVIL